MEENGDKSLKNLREQNTPLTFIKEMAYKREQLTYRVLPNTVATAAVLTKQVADVLDELNSVSSVKGIIVDNTNANNDCEGRLVTLLEKS